MRFNHLVHVKRVCLEKLIDLSGRFLGGKKINLTTTSFSIELWKKQTTHTMIQLIQEQFDLCLLLQWSNSEL